jgi:hypothetical protein
MNAIYNGSLPVTKGELGNVVRAPVVGSIADAAILLFGLAVPARATQRGRSARTAGREDEINPFFRPVSQRRRSLICILSAVA